MATKTAKKLTLKPLNDRVIVQPEEAATRTESGLYLPESAQEKPMTGKVIAAGPGKVNDDGERTALEVKVGDRVVYGKYSGNEVEINGEQVVILRESELLAKLD
ncbi:co-chaperone GroES [Planctomycetales bacterium ZRK34]|nr:co-chaperone GroES [Planctomycetales bacterium ZRK34]